MKPLDPLAPTKRRRRVRSKHVLITLVLTAFTIIGTQRGWFNKPAKVLQQNQPGLYSVAKFDDGDTIAVNMNGAKETIRFIGVDTPETHDPRKAVQCFGQA